MEKRLSSKRASRSGRGNLQDAKANLSRIVRAAQRRGPQRITLHDKDAAIIIRADEFDRLKNPPSGRDLVKTLANSPLADIEFDRPTVKNRVRDIQL
jgi:prevent-host-death family protein